ncbi:hypothetical protein GCM10010264_11300 [Streptomyces globisporus]|nr:hypothetical protein GCM10010264_11300 [Streptomyces globisporus]
MWALVGPVRHPSGLPSSAGFAFALPHGEKFALQREAYHPPAPGFLLSATQGFFSAEAAEQVIVALDIPGAFAVELSSEVVG